MKPLLPLVLATTAVAQPLHVGTFKAEIRNFHTTAEGLPSDDVHAVAVAGGEAYAATAKGLAHFSSGQWRTVTSQPVETLATLGDAVLFTSGGTLYRAGRAGVERVATLPTARPTSLAGDVWLATDDGLFRLQGGGFARVAEVDRRVRQVAVSTSGEVAVAAMSGLLRRSPSGTWEALYPRQGGRSWAPYDVRGVAYDSKGRLWFASAQGVGCFDGQWKLLTGEDGLPYDDFTTVAAGEEGVVWFGTRIGAVRYDGRNWEYRQGQRWLPHDEVRGIAVSAEGHAWLATAKGVSLIERRPMTLAEKARFFEDEIDKRHRRTPFGYVRTVSLKRPGDKSEWIQHDSDNDGLWTSMYGAGECFAWAATRSEAARKRAKAAFDALRFLGEVTQGGNHPAPRGFVARTILPTSGPNPNTTQYTRERDEQRRATVDSLWKVIVPRWPTSADGQWYWKTDTSSDELDGHYFFYAQYYDLVADTEAERQRVREHVRALTDHLIAHNYELVDHDGKPTRWAVFNPENLNHNPLWWEERGLNSMSILSYLKTAEHITGDRKYGEAARELIRKHSYGSNVLIWKHNAGPAAGNQSDDEMAFMSFYNLLRYETDPGLRAMWTMAFFQRWKMERYELNPLFNFLYAAVAKGVVFKDAFAPEDLTPAGDWLAESADTLQRFPLDRVNWGLKNSHRKDLVRLREETRRGHLRNGKVLPIDERFVEHWNHDPWTLDYNGNGLALADGAAFLLPYYLGLYHRFIAE